MSNQILKYEKIAPDVYAALASTERTGWVQHGVVRPETVKDHTLALLALADELAPLLKDVDATELKTMLEIHDWPEAICGDEVLLDAGQNDYDSLQKLKFEREKSAMEKICKSLNSSDDLFLLWLRFETSTDEVADLARQLDKYQAVEQAYNYQKEQGINLFDEFKAYSIKYISHPVLLDRLKSLEA